MGIEFHRFFYGGIFQVESSLDVSDLSEPPSLLFVFGTLTCSIIPFLDVSSILTFHLSVNAIIGKEGIQFATDTTGIGIA